MTEAIEVKKSIAFRGNFGCAWCCKKRRGCSPNALVNASLLGIDSHGVNLFEHYASV